MKAIVYEGPEKVVVKDVPVPKVQPGWTLVKVSHAGICGSDMTIYLGKHPRAKAPLIFGHEFSGWVESDHPTLPKGTLVAGFPYLYCGTCEICQNGAPNACKTMTLVGIDRDGGMAEYVLVPEDHLYAAPAGVSPQLAAYIEPIGISVHVMRHGGYRPGDSVVVFGAGGIGLAVAITLRQYGAGDLTICEVNQQRVEMARSLGFDVIQSGPDTLKEIYDRTDGSGADCVFDCAGHQSVVDILPDAVKINGRIVMVAGYKNPPQMNFQKGMMREFIVQFVRNCTRRDFEIACALTGKTGDYEKLLNCILPADKGPEGFLTALHPAKGEIKVMFKLA